MAIQDLLGLACLGDCLACCSYCSSIGASCDSYMLAVILGFLLGCRGLGGAWRGGCARLLPVLGRLIRQGPAKRPAARRRSDRGRGFVAPRSQCHSRVSR